MSGDALISFFILIFKDICRRNFAGSAFIIFLLLLDLSIGGQSYSFPATKQKKQAVKVKFRHQAKFRNNLINLEIDVDKELL